MTTESMSFQSEQHSDLDQIIDFQNFDTAHALFIQSMEQGQVPVIELVKDMKEHDTFGRS